VKGSLIIIVALAAAVVLAAGLAGGTSAARPSGIAAATVSTGSSTLGRILVDGKGRTLYLFEKDTRGRSACSGTCATYWPPLLTHGRPSARGGAAASLLGTSRRADGTTQVTYAGHPLYRYLPDVRPGQTLGQDLHDFGAGWYVVSQTGTKIEANGPGKNARQTGQSHPPRYFAR
jgi:predicted lipoprotein with Yx(FWY)xxD motif